MLITSKFFFACNVFKCSQNKFQYLSRICSVVCKGFQFGLVKSCVFRKSLLCSLQNSKILNVEIKAFADGKMNVALNPYQTTNFRLFQTEFADKNFKFDENGSKLSKRIENTVGKGGIARYEQFLLFPQCFQKACFPGALKGVIVWEWVNPSPNNKVFRLFRTERVCMPETQI